MVTIFKKAIKIVAVSCAVTLLASACSAATSDAGLTTATTGIETTTAPSAKQRNTEKTKRAEETEKAEEAVKSSDTENESSTTLAEETTAAAQETEAAIVETVVTEEESRAEYLESVHFEDGGCIMYAGLDGLNFRSGPSVDFDVISTFYFNEAVWVTGFGDNGWNRIQLNDGTVGYSNAEYLMWEEYIEPEPTYDYYVCDGCYGRFEIPAFGFSIGIDTTDNYDDSRFAYYTDYGITEEVADHFYQGFDVIYNCYPGLTCRIVSPEGYTRNFECVMIDRNCTWSWRDVTDSTGKSALFSPEYAGLLATRTCNDSSGISNTVVYWREY